MYKDAALERALIWIEPGPVVLVTTRDGLKNNVMTVSWTMAIDFNGHIALTTGPWNHSFAALLRTKQCVVCVPSASLAKTVVGIGTVSGAQVDKFKHFGLTAIQAKYVCAPLIDGMLACLECCLEDFIEPYGFAILKVLRVVENDLPKDARVLHARGDGTFCADGERFDFRDLMAQKLPPGL